MRHKSLLVFDYSTEDRRDVGAALIAVGDAWGADLVDLVWESPDDVDFRRGIDSAPDALAEVVYKGYAAVKYYAPGVREWVRDFGAASSSVELLGLRGKRRSLGIADAGSLIIEGTREDLVRLLDLREVADLSALAVTADLFVRTALERAKYHPRPFRTEGHLSHPSGERPRGSALPEGWRVCELIRPGTHLVGYAALSVQPGTRTRRTRLLTRERWDVEFLLWRVHFLDCEGLRPEGMETLEEKLRDELERDVFVLQGIQYALQPLPRNEEQRVFDEFFA